MIKSEQAELQKETEGKTRCVTEIEATIEATINRINMNYLWTPKRSWRKSFKTKWKRNKKN